MNQHDGHDWHTRSHHHTSEGLVRYQACRCGAWRVLRGPIGGPPAATVVARNRAGRRTAR
ncbi:hypothetical protein Sru01_50620 [Sphaerisporangium rufum]|uniref:Uncharacterized protein n=1 Tax=Sphaerisporangium rufum TaxID=1381558 RepID=A0A919R8D6_9ACTN|nr:hypothetical protein [Sphaerisporangium rufum]GII80080.1 hypothetical protein Sru01_50620 [Sphaerisporangium rufum]